MIPKPEFYSLPNKSSGVMMERAFSDVRCFRKISSPVYTVFSKIGEQTKKEKHKEPENSGSTWENGEGEAPRQLGCRLESEGGRFQEEPPQEQVNQTHGLMC